MPRQERTRQAFALPLASNSEPMEKHLKQILLANRNHILRPFGWELTNELDTNKGFKTSINEN
jgi:hypothetical protein